MVYVADTSGERTNPTYARAATLREEVDALKAKVAHLGTDIALLHGRITYLFAEQQVERERQTAIAFVSAMHALSTAFGCGGYSFHAQLRKVFRASQDESTALGREVANVNAEVKWAFATHAAWWDVMAFRGSGSYPVSDMLELLELEDKGAPLAHDAIIFLLLATRRHHLNDDDEPSVAEIMEHVKRASSGFPTERQTVWMGGLGLGA